MNPILVIARFAGEGAAVLRYADALDRLTGQASSHEPPAWAERAGFVERTHNGRLRLRGNFAGHYVDVDEGENFSRKGAGDGAAGGGLAGVLLGPPGIAVGLVVGLSIGAHLGIPDECDREPQAVVDLLRASLPRSSSAIVLIAASPEADELIEALDEQSGEVTRRPLEDRELEELKTSLEDFPAVGSG